MDWQQQADFLQRWPALHSLLAAYIAVEEDELTQVVAVFCQQNSAEVVAQTIEQLTQLCLTESQSWWPIALRLAGVDTDNHQAWLNRLLCLLMHAPRRNK